MLFLDFFLNKLTQSMTTSKKVVPAKEHLIYLAGMPHLTKQT